MTVSAETLGALIAEKLQAGPYDEEGLNAAGIPADDNARLEAFADRIAEAVIEHLTTAAEVVGGAIT